MDLVVFVVLACRIFGKPALQATLRIFGLCGSCVVLVWVVLWFLDRLWFLALVCASYCSLWFLWLGGLAIDADGCASYCSLWFLWLGGLARIDARPLALCGLLKRFAHRPNS